MALVERRVDARVSTLRDGVTGVGQRALIAFGELRKGSVKRAVSDCFEVDVSESDRFMTGTVGLTAASSSEEMIMVPVGEPVWSAPTPTTDSMSLSVSVAPPALISSPKAAKTV